MKLDIGSALKGLISPITDIIKKKQERKQARESAAAKLKQLSMDNDANVTFNDQEWEALAQTAKGETWTDEYATVSILSIVNLVVLGGILSAFGKPELLTGVVLAISTMAQVGIDIGFLAEAVVLAAIGLTVWRKL
jgi:hypothetical protein